MSIFKVILGGKFKPKKPKTIVDAIKEKKGIVTFDELKPFIVERMRELKVTQYLAEDPNGFELQNFLLITPCLAFDNTVNLNSISTFTKNCVTFVVLKGRTSNVSYQFSFRDLFPELPKSF